MLDSWPWWAYLLLGIIIGFILFSLIAYFIAKKIIAKGLSHLALPTSTDATDILKRVEGFGSKLTTVDDTVYDFQAKKHEANGQLVWEIPEFLTAEECDELMEKGAEADSPAAKRFSKLVSKVTGVPQKYQGPMTLKKYGPGDHEEVHMDAVEGDVSLKDSTVSVYLSGGPEGITEFPKMAGLNIQPEKGKAVFFYNLDDDKPVPESAHKEHAPTTFDKWIATIWTYKNPPPALKKEDVDTPL